MILFHLAPYKLRPNLNTVGLQIAADDEVGATTPEKVSPLRHRITFHQNSVFTIMVMSTKSLALMLHEHSLSGEVHKAVTSSWVLTVTWIIMHLFCELENRAHLHLQLDMRCLFKVM